jgi:hypothetical protein
MKGGAHRAHEVLSECGFSPNIGPGQHFDNLFIGTYQVRVTDCFRLRWDHSAAHRGPARILGTQRTGTCGVLIVWRLAV